MKRRNFLAGAAASAAVLGWPDWLRRAFAEEGKPGCEGSQPFHGGSGGGSVFEAYKRAQKAGKPLLIFVIPADDSSKYARGVRFGELLNHGTDAQLAPLALAEVVCATMEKARALVPDAPAGEPFVLRVETDAVPARVEAFEPGVPEPVAPLGPQPKGDDEKAWRARWEAREKHDDQEVDNRIVVTAQALRAAVVGPGALPDRRVSQAGAALGARAGEVERALSGKGVMSPELADAGAALLFREGSPRAIAALVQAVRARLVKAVVPGSRWASAGGCGTTVEGDDSPVMMACGMGHTPEKSQRFLYFYAQTPGEQWRARHPAEKSGDKADE